MVFTINLVDVNAVFTLHLEKIFKGYNKLTSQDYVINKDKTSLFIKITKKLECGEEYHLKIKTLQNGFFILKVETNEGEIVIKVILD